MTLRENLLLLVLSSCAAACAEDSPATAVDPCPIVETDLVIASAGDADTLPARCFHVAGSVTVRDSDLRDLAALEGLRSAENLTIVHNGQLQALALDGVEITGRIVIDSNEALTTVDGLEYTEKLRELTINNNNNLDSLDGLRNITEVGEGGMTYADNGGLGNLRELNKLRFIEGALVISGNTGLTQIQSLGALSTIGGDLSIERNNSLIVINGLTAKLRTIVGDVRIVGNPVLSDLYELCVTLDNVGGTVIIEDNGALIDHTCSPVVYTSEMNLSPTRGTITP